MTRSTAVPEAGKRLQHGVDRLASERDAEQPGCLEAPGAQITDAGRARASAHEHVLETWCIEHSREPQIQCGDIGRLAHPLFQLVIKLEATPPEKPQ